MPSVKLQTRVAGTRVCQPCRDFEMVCYPYIHLLLTKRPLPDLKKATTTLYPDFASLNASAEAGCDICRRWRKAILNECYSRGAEEALLKSTLPVELQPPTELGSSIGLNIHVKSPLPTMVKVSYTPKWRFNDDSGNIRKDDIKLVELAKQARTDTVGQIDGRTRQSVHLHPRLEIDPLNRVLWKRVVNWMEHCVSNHTVCTNRHQVPTLPMRLVQILDDGSNMKIVDTAGMSQDLDYVALSYCWGGQQEIMLDTKHEDQLRNSFARSKFPQTIQETFTVCTLLGIGHVWIDALCIRQDDGGQDFDRESRRMNEIYGSAKITIVACSAESAQEGLLQQRSSERLEMPMRSALFADGQLIIQRKGLAEVRAKSPLASRGWCFQEELLARRLLYFTNHGVYWSCSEIELAENGNHLNLDNEGFDLDPSLTILDPHSFVNRDDPLFVWDEMIDQYSSRDLTWAEDRLPAVRGLGGLIEQRTGEEFLYGMWKSRLPGQLLWVVTMWGEAKQKTQRANRVVPERAIPSWSWVLTLPRQKLRMPGSELSHSRAKLIETFELDNTTCLVLQGRIRPLLDNHTQLSDWPVQTILESRDPRKFQHTNDEFKVWAVNNEGSELFVREEGRDPILIQLDRRVDVAYHDLTCFEVNYKGFILLESVGEDKYRRVGCAQLHNDAAFFALFSIATIRLI